MRNAWSHTIGLSLIAVLLPLLWPSRIMDADAPPNALLSIVFLSLTLLIAALSVALVDYIGVPTQDDRFSFHKRLNVAIAITLFAACGFGRLV
jgi:predicted membrane channel-forming protein YqfA (hemolysin III family)